MAIVNKHFSKFLFDFMYRLTWSIPNHSGLFPAAGHSYFTMLDMGLLLHVAKGTPVASYLVHNDRHLGNTVSLPFSKKSLYKVTRNHSGQTFESALQRAIAAMTSSFS